MMQITTSEIFDEITSRIPQNEYGEKLLIEVLVQLDQMQVVNDLELKEEEKQHTGKHRNTAGQKAIKSGQIADSTVPERVGAYLLKV